MTDFIIATLVYIVFGLAVIGLVLAMVLKAMDDD